jgi:EAL domain-containing protein (putative c-di-GMP-specific phosphodiesterase class I)
MKSNGGVEQAIVRKLADLAGDLGIIRIEEFVETEALLSNVQFAVIDYSQGY